MGDAAVLPDTGVPSDSAMPPDSSMPPPTDGGTPDSTVVDSPLVDPTCVDGMYSETLPNPSASIDDLLTSYSASAFQTFIDSILDRRYPIGSFLVRGGRSNPSFPEDCDVTFVGSTSPTSDQVFQRLGTIVHECGHTYDFTLGGFSDNGYAIRDDLSFTCPMGDTTDRGGQTFPRSELTGDAYYPMRPACGTDPCDFYADRYLISSGSEQGFNSVLEEATQYVNSLATAYAFADRRGSGSQSDKDGILTFLWYIERYLRLARTEYPAAYGFITGNDCWRELILTIWGRGWLYLELTRDDPRLGIHDDELFPLVEDPELVAEIQAIRDAHGCSM